MISLSILFVFLALRYNFGNDYGAYYNMFYNTMFDQRMESDVEYGYNVLVAVFKPFGFFTLIIFWSAFYCYTLYLTIKRYISERYYWLIIFALISNPDLVFFGASAIRQTLAICCIFLSLPYLEHKKLIKFYLLIILASLFHLSALTFVILYPLMYLNLRNKFFILGFGLLTIATMTVLKSQFENIIYVISESLFEKYAERYGDSDYTVEGGTVGLIIRIIFLVLFLWSMCFEKFKIHSIFYILAIVGIVIFSLRDFNSVQRFILYFGYMMAFCFSYMLDFIEEKKNILYRPILLLILVWNANMAISFASQTISLFEYHTIFESDTINVSDYGSALYLESGS